MARSSVQRVTAMVRVVVPYRATATLTGGFIIDKYHLKVHFFIIIIILQKKLKGRAMSAGLLLSLFYFIIIKIIIIINNNYYLFITIIIKWIIIRKDRNILLASLLNSLLSEEIRAAGHWSCRTCMARAAVRHWGR